MEEKANQILYKNNIIQPLKGFCTVIEEGNITKATQKLHLTEGTISKQIQSLERELGFDLFIRKRNFMQPTEKALRFYEIAIARLNDIENLFKEFLDNENEAANNTIRIAAHYGIIEKVLPKIINEFHKNNKNIMFEIYNITFKEAIKKLESNDVDIIIYQEMLTNNKKIKLIDLFTSDPILVLPKNHFLAKKEEEEINFFETIDNFIDMNENITFDFFKNVKKDYNMHHFIKIINPNWNTTMAFAKYNNGITGVYDFFVDYDSKDFVYKNIKHLYPQMHIRCAINIDNYKNTVNINNLIDKLKLFKIQK